jgi:hypothetical protein
MQPSAGAIVIGRMVEQPSDPAERLLRHRQDAAAAGHVIHPAQLRDHGAEPANQLARHPAPNQPGHQRLRLVHQPLVRRSGQRRTSQSQEHSTFHPTITTAQQNCRIDGTPVVPRSDKHELALGILGGLVTGVCVG